MLRSIFYARFHSERGPVILRQYPHNAIFGSKRSSIDNDSSIQFNDISSYIIPPYELCNTPLSISTNRITILGHPVSIEDAKYPRNRFTFNVCFVLEDGLAESQRRAWYAVVNKTSQWFRSIEIEQEILSSIDEAKNLSTQDIEVDAISGVLRQVFEQLSEYEECCVQLTDEYVLNLRLHIQDVKPRQTVNNWDVPLLVAELPRQDVVTWNLVLQQIHAHINGVNHVKRIAALADAELELVQLAIQDLVDAGTAMLLDIFHFQAVYAPTQALTWFIKSQAHIDECCQYVAVGDIIAAQPDDVLDLFFCFQQGTTVAEICLAHKRLLKTIDIRRLITFGVIKGCLRRIHRYAQLQSISSVAQPAATLPPLPSKDTYEDAVKSFERAWKQAALSSGWATPPATLPPSIKAKAARSAEEARREEDEKLKHFLTGQHCFDEICVEMGMSEKALLERIKSKQFGEVTFFAR